MTESSFRLYIEYERIIVYNRYCKEKIIPYRETNYKKSIGKSKKFRFFDMNRDE